MSVGHHRLLASILVALVCCRSCLAQDDDGETTKSQLNPVECISCDWISEDMTKTLFQLNSYAQAHFKDADQLGQELGKLLKNNGPDEGWQILLRELDRFGREPRCDLNQVGKLTALEARLEEGEHLDAPHEAKVLSLYLEQLHLQHLQLCRQEIGNQVANWKSDDDLQATRKTFVQFADHLKDNLANYKAQNSRGFGSLWFTGLAGAMGSDESDKKKPKFEHETDLLNRGKAIISRGHLFEKVQSTSGRFFGSDQATCRQTLGKHQAQLEKLGKIIEPLKWLANYNPLAFVHGQMADKDRKRRKLLSLMPREQERFLKSNKEVDDWLALQGFLKRTFGRREELCSTLPK